MAEGSAAAAARAEAGSARRAWLAGGPRQRLGAPGVGLPGYLGGMDRLASLQEFLRDDPDDPFTRFALAQEYAKQGNAEQALAFYQALVRDRPDYVGTYFHLGALLRGLGRDDDARGVLRAGVRAATAAGDTHARAELQGALLEAEGLGFDD